MSRFILKVQVKVKSPSYKTCPESLSKTASFLQGNEELQTPGYQSIKYIIHRSNQIQIFKGHGWGLDLKK